MATNALLRSERWLEGAARAEVDGRWDDVIFSSQMAVEVSSKAVLLALGIDFPKQHDVSSVFTDSLKDREVPSWFKTERLASTIAKLAEMRSMAEYAYEKGEGVEFFKGYEATALAEARTHVSVCRRLLEESFQTKLGQ
jgi:HEPN domain-containing protein